MSNEFNLTKMTVTQFLAKKAEEEEEERAREKGVGGGPPVYLEDPVRGIPYNGPEVSTGNSWVRWADEAARKITAMLPPNPGKNPFGFRGEISPTAEYNPPKLGFRYTVRY